MFIRFQHCFLVGVMFLLLAASGGFAGSPDEPLFARYAVARFPAKSPDRKTTLNLTGSTENWWSRTNLSVRQRDTVLKDEIWFGINPEVLWSPDSRSFTITGSEGGALGQYQTDAFLIRAGKLVRIPLTKLIEEAFGHPVACSWPEKPNVAAVKWLEPSKTLLVAAEILGHSNCDSMGTFRGYVVDLEVPRVVKTYDQLAMKRLYGSYLGPELRIARDNCVRNPRSCYVLPNHPELIR